MNKYLIGILKSCIVPMMCIGLSACQHKPMAFAEIIISGTGDELSSELVAARIENLLIEKGIERIGSDGYSEITNTYGPIDYSSNRFVVSVVKDSDQIVIGVYEEAEDFSETGTALIANLIEVIKSWQPDALVEVRKITPKVIDQ